MTRKLWLLAGIAMVLCGCTRSRTMGGAQGQTHWLASCKTDADCGEQSDLSCLCSVCVAQCGAANSCEVDGKQTECFGSNAAAVRSMCGPSGAPSLCLEPCDGECRDGQHCVDGACITTLPDDMTGHGAGSGAAGTAAAGGGAAGAAGAGDEQPVTGTPLRIELVNNRPAAVSAQTVNCNGNPAWFQILIDNQTQDLYAHCQTECSEFNPSSPNGCPPACVKQEFATLQSAGTVSFEWDGLRYASDPRGCVNHVAVPSGTALQVNFCWSKTLPKEDIPGLPTPPPAADIECQSTSVRLGDQPSVRFEIN